MNWLITGGCGFIGSNLIRRLNEIGGEAVRVIDNLSVGTVRDLAVAARYAEYRPESTPESYQPGCTQFIRGDILDQELAIRLGRETDVIIHLAANTGVGPSVENPRADCVTNVVGTLNYLESARANDVKRFVFASSGAPVGECEPPIDEEKVPHPVSPYGASKLAGEGYCSAYSQTYGIETVSLRFSNVYGPGSEHKNSVVAKFIKQAIQGELLEVYGDGGQTRDFLYIDDLVRAILLSVHARSVGGEIFQIATASETSIAELLNLLAAEFARQGRPRVEYRLTSPRLGDVRRNYSDTSKAFRALGWKSEVSLREGLSRTVEYFAMRHAGRTDVTHS